MNKEVLRKLIGEQWFEVLNIVLTPEVAFHIDGVREQYKKGVKVYPSSDKVWKAFQECSYEDLKVIIIGQDPYFYPEGQATGLAFDCGVEVSPSMEKIQEAFQDSFPNHFNTNILDGKLQYLAKQGVLLLNASLTVEAGKANSHKHLWEKFTKNLLHTLHRLNPDLVFIAIGKDAQAYLPANIGIRLEHPAYAARQNRAWKYDNFFKRTNELLKQLAKQEIKWN
jgi:uracil-DNA glycosylase